MPVFIIIQLLFSFNAYAVCAKRGYVKNTPLNVRNGPSNEYKNLFQIHKKGLPVKILHKIDNWCMMSTYTGDSGWCICAGLSIGSSIAVLKTNTTVYRIPTNLKQRIATLKNGDAISVRKCHQEWCRVLLNHNYKKITGWVKRSNIWDNECLK